MQLTNRMTMKITTLRILRFHNIVKKVQRTNAASSRSEQIVRYLAQIVIDLTSRIVEISSWLFDTYLPRAQKGYGIL